MRGRDGVKGALGSYGRALFLDSHFKAFGGFLERMGGSADLFQGGFVAAGEGLIKFCADDLGLLHFRGNVADDFSRERRPPISPAGSRDCR